MLDNYSDTHGHHDNYDPQDPYGWDKLTPRVLEPWEEESLRLQPHLPLAHQLMMLKDVTEQFRGLTALIHALNDCVMWHDKQGETERQSR